MRQVVFVVFPEISLLDLAGPLQVFAWARHAGTGALAYDVANVSLAGGVVLSDTVLTVETEPMGHWADRAIDTLIVVGGDGVYGAVEDAAFVHGLTALISASRRICSVCSGAIALAATGLLDGRRAVTHWDDFEALATAYPDVLVEEDPIYIKDQNVWTSAGVTSGIDMSLGIVAEDLGQDAALERAQALVTYMVRPGGQSQFSPVLRRQKQDREGRFEGLHRWIAENLQTDLKVERLAEQQGMSLRSFHRLYGSVTGTTPAKAVEAIRLETARDLLETTDRSVKAIAGACGFGDVERMRRAFLRELGVTPALYRDRFGIAG
ncbi:MAG: helix-turn-helix domain-containing protein [Pseudomonadota bacterium]